MQLTLNCYYFLVIILYFIIYFGPCAFFYTALITISLYQFVKLLPIVFQTSSVDLKGCGEWIATRESIRQPVIMYICNLLTLGQHVQLYRRGYYSRVRKVILIYQVHYISPCINCLVY